MPRIGHREQRRDNVFLFHRAIGQRGFDVVPVLLHMGQFHKHGREITQRTVRQTRVVRTVVDARIQTAREHARIEAIDRRTQWRTRIADQLITGAGIDGISTLQRRGQAHIDVNMRAAHNRADNAIDSGLNTIDRQFKSTREIVAGTRRHYAERFAGAAHGIGAKRNHAVTADHHQVVIFVSTVPGVQQRAFKTLTGHIDNVETMLAPGFPQQADHLIADFGALAFVRRRIADNGNGRIHIGRFAHTSVR